MDRLFAYFDRLKPGDRLVLALALCGLVVAFLAGLVSFGNRFLVEAPRSNSVVTEGFVGVPRFVNPVLATTQLDKDLVTLVYAGVMKVDAAGDIVADLAERVEVSSDGTVYTVVLAQEREWSDGTSVTAEDVAFTIRTIQDPLAGSPLRAQFQNVSVEVVGTHEVVLTIPARDPSFLESLTVGMLPAHIWSSITADRLSYSEYNVKPVGAGAFVLSARSVSVDGSPEVFVFTPNTARDNAPQVTVRAAFFANEALRMAALKAGTIDMAAGIDATQAAGLQETGGVTLVTRTLPRTFGIFFNQKTAPALLDTAAREAFDILIDRPTLTHTVLGEYAESTREPLSPQWQYGIDAPTKAVTEVGVDAARARLTRGGWVQSETDNLWTKKLAGATTTLSFTITTLNAPVFTATAAELEARFAELGVPVKVVARERADINTMIAAREYEVLLYGTAFGRARDLYPFWHSSRRVDPGLNVALYANLSADAALERMRSATNAAEYAAAYTNVMSALNADTPALFLFSPHFIYAVRDNVTLTLPVRIADQSERFALASEWYKETEHIWRIFVK